jgi:hypothetical protein
MDYSSKWLIGLATAPYIILSFFVGEQSSALLTLICFLLSTVAYSLIIVKAKPVEQGKRFVLFTIFPFLVFAGVMYV